eukprot:288861_1
MPQQSCATKSLKPIWVTVGFALCSLIMLIITMIRSMRLLQEKKHYAKSTKSSNLSQPQRSVNLNFNQVKEHKEEIKETEMDIVMNMKEYTEVNIMEEEEKANEEMVNESEWDKAQGCFGKFKLCAKDVWGRKSVYLPLISHLSDTATDFASVVEFGIVAASSNPIDCGINVWYLFASSIICMVIYRIISSIIIYR